MIFQIISYIKFIINSYNGKAIKSIFLNNIIDKVFKSELPADVKQIFKAIRKSLTVNHQIIQVTDYGQGSKLFRDNYRKVAKIAMVAGIGRKRGELLIRLIQYFKPENILELGTSVGMGTACLSLGNSQSNITSLEGCPETAGVANNLFKEFGLTNIKVVVGPFEDTLNQVLDSQHYDFIYFDGNHSKDATLDYFTQCLFTLTEKSVWLFDDIHWSKDMEAAWEIIKAHKQVTSTIDTYRWGLVFFKPTECWGDNNISV